MTKREAVLGLYDKFAAEFGSLEQAKIEVDKILCGKSLAAFVKQAWHVVEPGQPYVHGWHIDFICAHLEAITNEMRLEDGSIYNRLLINIPPGTMKSLLTNVFWPAWEWGPKGKPHLRYVCAAHKVENLSARDSRRMRQLITSEWYRERWGDKVNLTADQNEKLNFQNTAGGFRMATAISSLTGIRGDRVIIDDPHSVDSAASEAMRESEVTTFLEAIPTRLNDPIKSSIVVIMQRLHQEDVSGVIIEKELGYDHIMLPMRYDPLRAAPTKLGLEDPRSEEGELLFPQRFPEHVVDRDENAMGPYATAGQHQQEPSPRGGGVIKRDWWQLWEGESFPPFDFVVASLDTAYTSKQENDPSALTVWGVFSGDVTPMMADNFVSHAGIDGRELRLRNKEQEAARFDEMTRVANLLSSDPESTPRIMLMYAWAERLELPELIEKVAKSCRRMKVDHLLIENKASGISVGQEIRRLYGHESWGVQLVNPGAIDKLARLYSVQHLFSEGVIYAPDLRWADQVIHQCEVFPKGKHDDLVDTTSMALKYLRETGILVRQPERIAEIDAGRQHRGKPLEPLYSV
jgi:predicted phage terminase large subunit-like protein